MTDQPYTPSEGDLRWEYAVKRMHDGASADTASDEFGRGITKVKRDAAREALDGLLKHIGHPARPSPLIGPGGLQHYIRANYPDNYCDRCNYDMHVCPGCGVSLPHGTEVCEDCNEENR